MPPQGQYIRVRTGLFEAKHLDRIGGWPMCLYLWLHSRVRFKGDEAGVMIEPYTHAGAAVALNQTERAVREWFALLRRHGYVTARQLRHGLEVTITNYDVEGLRVPPQRHPDPSEGATDTAPSRVKGVTTVAEGCHPDGRRVPPQRHPQIPSIYKDGRAGAPPSPHLTPTTRDSSREHKNAARKRAQTQHQRVIDAYLIGCGDDPADVPPTVYRRYLGDGAALERQMVKLGASVEDVTACAVAVRESAFFKRNAARPKMETVRVRLEKWIADGRPTVWADRPANVTPMPSKPKGNSALSKYATE